MSPPSNILPLSSSTVMPGPVADAGRAAGHAVEQGGFSGVGHAQ